MAESGKPGGEAGPKQAGTQPTGQDDLDDVELGMPKEQEKDGCCTRCCLSCANCCVVSEKKAADFRDELQAKDPVQQGRCSVGTLVWVLIGIAGCVLLGVGIETLDVWEIISSSFLILLSGYTVIFLGGDPCLMDAFRDQLNFFHGQNVIFKDNNKKLEVKIQSLSGVTVQLEEVSKKMGADVEAATKLLHDMERFSALQSVSAVVNQFFAADFDGSGHINGDEAHIFVPQLSSLWALVPNFDPERLVAHVREHGLTLQQLSVLLNHLVADDGAGCTEELERIIAEGAPKSKRALDAQVRSADGPAHLEELYEAASMMNEKVPKWVSTAIEEDKKAKNSDVLKPLCKCGSCTVWSILHLVLIIATLGGLTLTVASFVVLEITNIAGAILGFFLSAALMAASRLIEVLRALRREVKMMRVENRRLEANHKGLSAEVVRLSKLQKGLQVLQAECGGNVELAKELITKSNLNTKCSAMAVITRFFREADVNRNQTIDENEVDAFVERLQLAFGSVATFDVRRVRALAKGMGVRELKSLVDVITTVQAAPEPEPDTEDAAGAANGPASGQQAEAAAPNTGA